MFLNCAIICTAQLLAKSTNTSTSIDTHQKVDASKPKAYFSAVCPPQSLHKVCLNISQNLDLLLASQHPLPLWRQAIDFGQRPVRCVRVNAHKLVELLLVSRALKRRAVPPVGSERRLLEAMSTNHRRTATEL